MFYCSEALDRKTLVRVDRPMSPRCSKLRRSVRKNECEHTPSDHREGESLSSSTTMKVLCFPLPAQHEPIGAVIGSTSGRYVHKSRIAMATVSLTRELKSYASTWGP